MSAPDRTRGCGVRTTLRNHRHITAVKPRGFPGLQHELHVARSLLEESVNDEFHRGPS